MHSQPKQFFILWKLNINKKSNKSIFFFSKKTIIFQYILLFSGHYIELIVSTPAAAAPESANSGL